MPITETVPESSVYKDPRKPSQNSAAPSGRIIFFIFTTKLVLVTKCFWIKPLQSYKYFSITAK